MPETVTLEDLTVDDEKAFRDIALYADLKEILRRARYPFLVLPAARPPRRDRALFLNLTYWAAKDGLDVLADRHLPADVVAHIAWHHLAARQLGSSSVDAMLLGESIASAFDLYLVGRLLGRRGRSAFLDSQVPAMADSSQAAGLSARGFEGLLRDVASDPERAFGDLRALLFTAARTLFECPGAAKAERILSRFGEHRFGSLLHHYELSNWILFARAHAKLRFVDRRAQKAHHTLLNSKGPLDWLAEHWVVPAMRR